MAVDEPLSGNAYKSGGAKPTQGRPTSPPACLHGIVRTLLDTSDVGWTLPQPFYTDPDIYAFDVCEVFTRCWLMIGFEAELPESNSYLAITIGRNPIVVVRGRDGEIRGFHNTCRHRGSQICADGTGQARKFICPYHKWTYELDGRLTGAPRMPATFKPAHYGLRPIRIELMAGCIYAALTDEVPDFTPFRSQVAPFLEPYRLANAKVAFQSRLVERANWKLVMENARECYHCPTGHPELRVAYPVTFGRGFEYRGDPAHLKTFESRIAELGLPSMPVRGSWWNAARYPLNPGMESLTMNGASVVRKRLVEIDEKILGGVRWAIEPNNFCHALPDYAFMFSAVPIGAEETHVLSTWLVHKDAVEGKDYTIDSLTELWTKTNLQDRALSENNQKGVNGFGYSPGPYSEDAEHFVIEFVNWYRAAAQAATRDG